MATLVPHRPLEVGLTQSGNREVELVRLGAQVGEPGQLLLAIDADLDPDTEFLEVPIEVRGILKQPLPGGVRGEVAGANRSGVVARPPPEPRLPTQRIDCPVRVGLRVDERHAREVESDGQELAGVVVDEDYGVFTDPRCGSGATYGVGLRAPRDLDGNEVVES